jgi:3-phenylpropionate/trans-cinnamate dioxygenase ferredoxin subunit
MALCPVAKLADLDSGSLMAVTAGGKQVCLARLASGEVFAMSDICSHEWIELSEGDLDGEDVECPAHGSRFNVRTGDVSGLPAEEPVATYPVTIEDDQIFVEI